MFTALRQHKTTLLNKSFLPAALPVTVICQVRYKSDSSSGSGNGGGSKNTPGNFNFIRGRRKRSKFPEKYFEPQPWDIDSTSFSPFTALPPSSPSDSTSKHFNSGAHNFNKDFVIDGSKSSTTEDKDKQKKKDEFSHVDETKKTLDFDTGINMKTLDVFQKIIQANSGRQQTNRKSTHRFSQLSLKDAVTFQEYADVLEGMLNKSTPRTLKSHLDEFIIGQDAAKQALSCAVFNHYTRVLQSIRSKREGLNEFPSKPGKNSLDKSNILVLGPSGSGKTLMAKRIAEILEVPFCMNDATSFTQAGYVGDDVEQCVARLLQAAEYDVRKAEIGIIFIDEIDKISKKDAGANSAGRDVAGEGVQQALLKMLEGTTLHVTEKGRKKNDETIAIDTSNILFILSGAFVGLEKLVAQRNTGTRSIGFGHRTRAPTAKDNALMSPGVTEVDLINYGLIPEFVGRIPIVVQVNKLTEDELVRILSEPKNCLVDQYQQLFQTWNIRLSFSNEALHTIARKVMSRQTGARGLKFVMEEILKQPMFFAPGSEIRRINVDENLNATYETDSSAFTIVEDPLSSNIPQRVEIPMISSELDNLSVVSPSPASAFPPFSIPSILKPTNPPVGNKQ